jgi:hypothetical protein
MYFPFVLTVFAVNRIKFLLYLSIELFCRQAQRIENRCLKQREREAVCDHGYEPTSRLEKKQQLNSLKFIQEIFYSSFNSLLFGLAFCCCSQYHSK